MSRLATNLSPIDATPEEIAKSLFPPRPVSPSSIEQAKDRRNAAWIGNPLIPSWIAPHKVKLDRFFTRPAIARECHASLLDAMARDHANAAHYKFVEPAAGTGAFFDLLPPERAIGLDILTDRSDFQQCDYLGWKPPANGHSYVAVGNPPFGYRAWLALAFVNHSATFADYIGFILPMAFQSEGKGSPKHRVNGAELVQSMSLPPDAFLNETGQSVKINALWQVWRRGVNNRTPATTCDQWIDLFTVDMRKERLCGQDRLHDADWFLQRTFYGDPPSLVRDFSEVRYVCGYGIIIKKHKRDVTRLLQTTNWRRYSNLAAHNCNHISMYHIRNALTDAGFVDA